MASGFDRDKNAHRSAVQLWAAGRNRDPLSSSGNFLTDKATGKKPRGHLWSLSRERLLNTQAPE